MSAKGSLTGQELQIRSPRDDESGCDVVIDGWRGSDGSAWQMAFELKMVNGSMRASQFRISNVGSTHGVSASLLAELPIHSLVTKACEFAYNRGERFVPVVSLGSRRGRVLTEADHLETARLYQEAVEHGLATIRHISTRLQITPSAAAQRVHLSRRFGALQPGRSTRSRNVGSRKDSDDQGGNETGSQDLGSD